MKKLPKYFISIAMIIAVLGGLSRTVHTPFMYESRVFCGVAMILLLAAIAINTLPKEQ
jgi:hypothetical protein